MRGGRQLGHFFESDVVKAAYAFNSPLPVRHVSSSNTEHLLHTPPFIVEGAPTVISDTVKRGDGDDFSGPSTDKTLVLRLYDAYGGHVRPKVRIAKYIKVSRALITNLLEEEIEEVQLIGPERAEAGSSIALSM